jgi:hypothetical protein
MSVKIKKNSLERIITLCLGFMIILGISLTLPLNGLKNYTNTIYSDYLKTGDNNEEDSLLIDKVYTIIAPNFTLTFEDLHLFQYTNYKFRLNLVTPHKCRVNLSLFDPEGSKFDLVNTTLDWNIIDSQNCETFYGVAIEGFYNTQIYFILENNLNIHFKIELIGECFNEILEGKQTDELLLYRVIKFTSTRSYIEHQVFFETNVSYDLYIGRVSSNVFQETSPILMTYLLEDPTGCEFSLFNNSILLPSMEYHYSCFQTAISGLHILKLRIICNAPVNIAYLILDTTMNSTPPNSSPNPFNELDQGQCHIPLEIFFYSTLLVALFLIGVIIMLKINGKPFKHSHLNIWNNKN